MHTMCRGRLQKQPHIGAQSVRRPSRLRGRGVEVGLPTLLAGGVFMGRNVAIGIQSFNEIIEKNYFYVDKTAFIKEWWDSGDSVTLITRPRRFGKTLNMDMLRTFFEKSDEDTSVYFKDKMIWQCGDEYIRYQGKYPVIFLSFKDVKCSSW